MKLKGKIFIKGSITAETGLRVGGNKSTMEIGGVDLNVIKTGNGKPYIPGSSLKGKLRSLLAKLEGKESADEDKKDVKTLFGVSGGKEDLGPTRLFVRDLPLDTKEFESVFGVKEKRVLDYEFSEIKTENNIQRAIGTAQHPRQVERIPAGAKFDLNLVLDVYEGDDVVAHLTMIDSALQLLSMDYLGGHGSRGSGRVKIDVHSLNGKSFGGTPPIAEMTERPWEGLFTEFLEVAEQTTG